MEINKSSIGLQQSLLEFHIEIISNFENQNLSQILSNIIILEGGINNNLSSIEKKQPWLQTKLQNCLILMFTADCHGNLPHNTHGIPGSLICRENLPGGQGDQNEQVV